MNRIIERSSGKRLELGGPDQGGKDKFQAAGGELTDDWQYHAVTNILLAHSLIRSFPEVDAERTAVTGISWGGYLTCLSASIDHRFKAAAPVYGCGYLYEGESVQKPLIDRLPAEQKDWWIKNYDPSVHLKKCQVPIFFVNGTNDIHYPLDSYMKSYAVVPAEKNLRIEVKMRHSHTAGWEPSEIEAFIASKIKKSPPLAKVHSLRTENGIPMAGINSSRPIVNAHFHWTTDDGQLSKRGWKTVPAVLKQDNSVVAETVPEDATLWYFTVTDNQGQMTSSEMAFVNQ